VGPKLLASKLGGLVLAEKQMEMLEGLLKAYDARLKSIETIEQRRRRHQDPESEIRKMELISTFWKQPKPLQKGYPNHLS